MHVKRIAIRKVNIYRLVIAMHLIKEAPVVEVNVTMLLAT